MLPSVVQGGHKVPPPVTVPAATAVNTVALSVGASATAAPAVAAGTGVVTGLLIGLGGGALPMCLQRYLPNLHLYMCDLDATVEAVAREHFGFKCNARSTSFVADGLVVLGALFQQLHAFPAAGAMTDASAVLTAVGASGTGSAVSGSAADAAAYPTVPQGLLTSRQLDVLFIDADSKDTTQGISAPPMAFLTLSALVKMHAVLKAGGGVYINVVARSRPMLAELVAKLAAVFGISAHKSTAVEAKPAAGSGHKTTAAPGKKGAAANAVVSGAKSPVGANASDLARYTAEVAAVRAELGCPGKCAFCGILLV
jgi:hypothetical protein